MGGVNSVAMSRAVQLDDWLSSARPGAELPYAMGWSPSAAGEALNERLRRLAAGGYLYLKQRRADHGAGFVYIAERSSRPMSAKPLNPLAGPVDVA